MKPLRILLGNNTLALLAGSETWTLTLALQLKKMGHFVAAFSPDLGIIAKKLEENGIKCYSDLSTSDIKPFSYVLEENVKHEYDVIIANHWHIVGFLRQQFPHIPIISTIHGIMHFMEENGKQIKAPEHPALDAGVNQFVAVSEEVQQMLMADYNIESVVIRNFFDIKHLGSLPPANATPKQFLVNTNYAERDDEYIQVIRDVAKHYGATVAAIGQNFNQMSDTTRAIQDSDIVFGMGRSVLEGVAAGRLGIVQGRWGTGGPVVESNINVLRHFNFSGRNNQDKFATKEELIEMIDRYYKPSFLEWGKSYVAREHGVAFAAEKFVALARELTGQSYTAERPSAVDPAARPFKLAKT